MAGYLRSDEVSACVHRVALSRGAPFEIELPAHTPEMQRRRRSAAEHRGEVLEALARLHPDARRPRGESETMSMIQEGLALLLQPRLPPDLPGRRSASVHALIRVGRVGERFAYSPLLVKNHEVVEAASTRRTLLGTLELPRPTEATFVDGVGTRPGAPMTRSGLSLTHASRVLEALGHADPNSRGAIVDRQSRLWWLELAGHSYPRFNLTAYDHLYEERLGVLRAHDAWASSLGPFPTTPYWHRDCPECPYAAYCEDQLEAIDDVSLVRFTSFDQQLLLREHGVETRSQLARLDPEIARRARHTTINPLEPHRAEEVLGRSIDKLDDLIYRARARERGTSLRIVDPSEIGCPTADVEVDIDMESYEDTTYLWGAFVTLNCPVDGVKAGYRSFVEWGDLTPDTETRIFAEFWAWLSEVRDLCRVQGRTFRAYCFWAAAEDGAMNRAVANPTSDAPPIDELLEFRRAEPPAWIDLHELAKRQIQTEGPLGLKQLAMASGFHWRDPNPSGEASMVWYEVAVRDQSPAALASRERIVTYNEDDCRATKALRDWLNGPARALAHRDDQL
ncbi:MAG TPA: TM0106 family RecB-like putative nuclease [Acidimicrobiales bacterium]|nr:TM0106 family RecB-like putative nuclease [Acidimicrobiales bacterium]